MYKSLALISWLLWASHLSFAQEQTNLITRIFPEADDEVGSLVKQPIPIFRILPEDVVQTSIQEFRFTTNEIAVRWIFTEAGAKKMLSFDEENEGNKTCTAIGNFQSQPGIYRFVPMPAFTNYAQWKEGWLKHRTDKMFCKNEDDAKAIIAGLEGK
jgi:hypothetical protein